MMRSLFSAVSGLRNHQTAMDVIGNNISNVNTVGYKSNSVVFSDIYSQTLSSATGANQTTGGSNAQQIGLGVTISGIRTKMTEGSTQSTGNTLDFSITGEGYFAVRGSDGNTYYTRSGAFEIDEQGNLVTLSGEYVLGAMVADDEIGVTKLSDYNSMEGATVTKRTYDASHTLTSMSVATTDDEGTVTTRTYSDEGVTLTSMSVATVSGNTTTTRTYSDEGVTLTGVSVTTVSGNTTTTMNYSDEACTTLVSSSVETISGDTTTTTNYDATGTFTSMSVATVDDATVTTMNYSDAAATTLTSMSIAVTDADGVTSTKTYSDAAATTLVSSSEAIAEEATDAMTPIVIDQNLYSSYSIGGNGVITAVVKATSYTDEKGNTVTLPADLEVGDEVEVGRLVLATFVNSAGLEKEGSSRYSVSANSGDATISYANEGAAGELNSGSLEMSNVELASELTNMIIMQRGFQANSRVITTSDSMLEELVNLKRS